MKVLIIEDEVPAAEKLERYLKRYDDSIEVAEKLNSVSSSSAWLDQNQNNIDLIFMDIQLLDGKSFEIFDNVKITKPIIFITAFDEYAIDAFKVNSIDYLLKPITFNDLSGALKKLEQMKV
ncbi:MAG: response regulator, partial [Bacteroidota bacterium]